MLNSFEAGIANEISIHKWKNKIKILKMDALQMDFLHLLNKIFYQFQKHFA